MDKYKEDLEEVDTEKAEQIIDENLEYDHRAYDLAMKE